MNSFGRYEIKQKLGQGGMATVYLAHDPRFGRDVALKVLPPQFLHEEQFRSRFEREARTIAMLEHPAIVPVYDFGEHEGQPYLVMRYMNGGSLENRLQRGPLPKPEALQIIKRIASALDEAHKKGIVHRDLKPANILFDQYNESYLSDFGIVKLNEATANLTGNAIVGTPAYMSPEQVHGKADVDGRSDVYSLGVILYEMLSGHVPYRAITPTQQMMAHVLEPVPDILAEKTDIPAGFGTVIQHAMAKEANTRFTSAGEMAQMLEKASTGANLPMPEQPEPTAEGKFSFADTVLMSPPMPTPASNPTPTVVDESGRLHPALKTTLKTGQKIAWWGCVIPLIAGLTFIGLCAVGLIGIGIMFPVSTPTPQPSPTLTATPEEPTAEATPWPTRDETMPTPSRPPLDETPENRENSFMVMETFDSGVEWATGDVLEEGSDSDVVVSGQVTNGVYQFDLYKSPGIYWANTERTEGDGYYSLEVTFTDGPDDVGAGMVLMMNNHAREKALDFYMFLVNPHGDVLIARCYDQCDLLTPMVKSEWFASELVKPGLNQTNLLAVSIDDGYMQFFINDELVGEAYDDSFDEGLFGVMLTAPPEGLIGKATVQYDNYMVVTYIDE